MTHPAQVWPALTNPLLIKRLAGTVGLHRLRLVGEYLTPLHSKPLLQQYTSTSRAANLPTIQLMMTLMLLQRHMHQKGLKEPSLQKKLLLLSIASSFQIVARCLSSVPSHKLLHGVDLDDVALSRNTIQRARHETRSVVASEIRTTFTVDSPVLLHWDGKLLPDISGSKEVVDRVAILVTSGHLEQLLAVPKIGCGTGQQQCDACLCALDDWQLRSKVLGLVFDTTSSNTGLNLGACTLIEKALKRELI